MLSVVTGFLDGLGATDTNIPIPKLFCLIFWWEGHVSLNPNLLIDIWNTCINL